MLFGAQGVGLSGRENRRNLLATLAIGLVLTAGTLTHCRSDQGVAPNQIPSAEGLLFGGQRCTDNRDCGTRSCSYGMCNGFLMVPTDIHRSAMAPGIRKAAENPSIRKEMVELLSLTLGDLASDPYLRGRAADACSLLPASLAVPLVTPHLEDPEAPVRFHAARSLHRLGDPRGTRALRAFLEHPSEAVSALARLELQGPSRK